MAMLWRALQQEVLGTVDDFRQKGAVGAFRDAALDIKEIGVGAGSWVLERAKALDSVSDLEAVLLYKGIPPQGMTAPVEFPDGRVQQAVVVGIDSLSNPPVAQVVLPGSQQPLQVRIVDPETRANESGEPDVAPPTRPSSALQGLRQDVIGTVNDIRQSEVAGAVCKSVSDIRQSAAVGTIRDAAVETKGIATDAGIWLLGGVKELVAGSDPEAYLLSKGVPEQGATAPLHFPDGRVVDAVVAEIDNTFDPPRARVTIPGEDEPLLVKLLDPASSSSMEASPSSGSSSRDDATIRGDGGGDSRPSMLDGIKNEWNQTVQDFREIGAVGVMKDAVKDAVDVDMLGLFDGIKQEFKVTVQDMREKGVVGTVRDVALDAVDIVGSTATVAINGAKSITEPLIDLWAEEDLPNDGATSSHNSLPFEPPARVQPANCAPSASPDQTHVGTEQVSLTPVAPPPAATDSDASQTARKSLVSMRRNMFEKPKSETDEPMADKEEIID